MNVARILRTGANKWILKQDVRILDRDTRARTGESCKMLLEMMAQSVLEVHGHARSKLVADEAMREEHGKGQCNRENGEGGYRKTGQEIAGM